MTGCLLGESYDDKGQVMRKVFPCHDVIIKRSPPVLAMWWICEYDKGNWYDVAISFCTRKMRTSENQCSSAWRMQLSWRKYAQGPEQPPLWSNHDGCTINLVTQHRFTFYILHQQYMMTSSNGNFFPRYWPFVWGIHRWPLNSPLKVSDAELWCFLWFAPE